MSSSSQYPLKVSGEPIGVDPRKCSGNVSLTIAFRDRETLTALKPTLEGGKVPLLIFVNKGIEIKTHALTLEIIADTCGPEIAKVAAFIVSSPVRPCNRFSLSPYM